jgi:hypothetical protein
MSTTIIKALFDFSICSPKVQNARRFYTPLWLNLGFNFNTVNCNVLGVVIALVKFGLSRFDIMVLRICGHLENTVL